MASRAGCLAMWGETLRMVTATRSAQADEYV